MTKHEMTSCIFAHVHLNNIAHCYYDVWVDWVCGTFLRSFLVCFYCNIY